MKHNVPTIKEMARQLNVSVSTVSRALSDHPRIGLRTKMRVRELAEKLHYEPNAKAIFFKQKKSYTIGVVLPYIKEDFFSEAISGIENAAMEHDYTILFGQSYDDTVRERKVVEAMRRHRVDGILISLAKNTQKPSYLDALEKYNIPVVFFDRVPAGNKVHKVYCDIFKVTVDMVRWLYDNGYHRIGLINGPEKLVASKERMDGYVEAISSKKIKIDMRIVETTDLSTESTVAAVEKLLSLSKPPAAIISFNDYVHMDAVRHAESLQPGISSEVAFVSYGNLGITPYTAFPPRLSVEQYPSRQGELAMNCLMKILGEENELDAVQYQQEEVAAKVVELSPV